MRGQTGSKVEGMNDNIKIKKKTLTGRDVFTYKRNIGKREMKGKTRQ